MNSKKVKRLIAVLSVIVFIIILIIVYLIHFKEDPNTQNKKQNYNDSKNITETSVVDLYTPDETEEKEDIWEDEQSDEVLSEEKNNLKLKIVDDKYTYFLMKQCVTKFYNLQSKEEAMNIFDKEVINKLNINKDNISLLFSGFNNPKFCIDKIYKQKLDASKSIYVIYHRLIKDTIANTELTNSVLMVKIDEKNVDFSIYPYEYLKKYNLINLEENQQIELDNLDEIKNNNDNEYRTDDISKDDQTTITELFEKFKFDLNYDNENLYNTIDEEYREIYCNTADDFKDYLNRKKDIFNNDIINKYQVNKLNNYTQYIGICKNENHYIFKAKNLMEYTVLLDNYSTILPQYKELYYSNFPKVQAKYCIDRFIKAINDKNYEFAYSKLLNVQKNNYYPQLEDFENEIKNSFFEKNSYTFDDVIVISETVYQYTITLSDKQNESNEGKTLIATVTLKNNADFDIAFKMK